MTESNPFWPSFEPMSCPVTKTLPPTPLVVVPLMFVKRTPFNASWMMLLLIDTNELPAPAIPLPVALPVMSNPDTSKDVAPGAKVITSPSLLLNNIGFAPPTGNPVGEGNKNSLSGKLVVCSVCGTAVLSRRCPLNSVKVSLVLRLVLEPSFRGRT